MTIETERMLLRPLAEKDLDDLHAMFSDPVVMRFSLTGVRDREEARRWLEITTSKYRKYGHGFLAAALKDDGSYAGHAGLLRQEVDGDTEIEIGYWFARRIWGRGLATEAAIASRDLGFGEMGCTRLISLIVPENVASRKVAERVGMRCEKMATWKGTNVCVYSIQRKQETSR
jgi:ribosomal-protein-alanine N-acetyltransferase